MSASYSTLARTALPVACGVLGAALYIVSPLSHQAFCSPLVVPIISAPDGAASASAAD